MSADTTALVDTIVVILILLAIIVEIFLEWRWHKEMLKETRRKKKRR